GESRALDGGQIGLVQVVGLRIERIRGDAAVDLPQGLFAAIGAVRSRVAGQIDSLSGTACPERVNRNETIGVRAPGDVPLAIGAPMPEVRTTLFNRRRLQLADEIFRKGDSYRRRTENQTQKGAAECLQRHEGDSGCNIVVESSSRRRCRPLIVADARPSGQGS